MRLLVVDDDIDYGVFMVHLLDQLGHEAILAIDPWEAVELAREGIHAVITDIDMPRANGLRVARAIRRRAPHVPVAFCTGSPLDDEVTRRARRLGPVIAKFGSLASLRELVTDLDLARAEKK
jgi:CheY-like chemotaxis protein